MSTTIYLTPQPETRSVRPTTSLNLLWIAWGAMLLVSHLSNSLFLELGSGVPNWLIWAKIGFLLVLAVLSFAWPALRALRAYFVVLAVIYLASELFFRFSRLEWWQQTFHYSGATFSVTMLGEQGIRLAIALALIATLLLLGFRRADFFLVKGQLDAPVTPVRWMGLKEGDTWRSFGWQFLLGAVVILGIFLGVAAWSKLSALPQALPFLPAVLAMAVLNAFNEELTYRAALLAPLRQVVGDRQAIYIAATLFGLGHYTGVPYGVTGVIMAAFLGWALGKAMIETKGFAWAWFIHFVMDVMIFSLMVVGSITAGGA